MLSRVNMILLAVATLAVASAAPAATPATLIGPDLKPRQVNLQALGAGKISYFDSDRNMQVETAEKILQIRFPQEKAAVQLGTGLPNADGFIDAPELELTRVRTTVTVPDKGTLIMGGSRLVAQDRSAFVELIDGQRIIGEFRGADAAGEQLRFNHWLLGEITIALDKVARLNFDGSSAPKPTPANDQILLSNGDVLTGFVIAVREKEIEVQQGGAKPFMLPRDRVKALHLANPVNRSGNEQSMIWLRDGVRVLATEASISADKLMVACALAPKKPATVELAQVERIELASKAGQIIDLADLPMSMTSGGQVFGLAMEPRIEGNILRMHAPVTVSFELPAGAVRLAAMAELDADGEDTRLASFIISLSTTSETIARHAITGSEPAAAINAALTGKTLTLTLDPAAHGPVLDRLRLRDAVIFVERQ